MLLGVEGAVEEEIDAGEALDGSAAAIEKASEHLLRMVGTVLEGGVGPLADVRTWAESRLAKVQKDRYTPTGGSMRAPVADDAADIESTIRRLVIESVEMAALNGFVTGLGGLVTLPLAVPTNLAGALVINVRLAWAVAYLRGYDPADTHVRTVVTLVAVGSSAQAVMRTLGVKVGQKLATQTIKKVPIALIREINKKIGFTLIAKQGTKRGVIVLAKGVPVVGGVVGGAVDGTSTALIAKTARALFPLE